MACNGEFKIRLIRIGITLKDVCAELEKRYGEKVHYDNLRKALSNRWQGVRADYIKELAEVIVDDYERNKLYASKTDRDVSEQTNTNT